jgi:hypothetical protein
MGVVKHRSQLKRGDVHAVNLGLYSAHVDTPSRVTCACQGWARSTLLSVATAPQVPYCSLQHSASHAP